MQCANCLRVHWEPPPLVSCFQGSQGNDRRHAQSRPLLFGA